jgi:hypothetical protein
MSAVQVEKVRKLRLRERRLPKLTKPETDTDPEPGLVTAKFLLFLPHHTMSETWKNTCCYFSIL